MREFTATLQKIMSVVSNKLELLRGATAHNTPNNDSRSI